MGPFSNDSRKNILKSLPLITTRNRNNEYDILIFGFKKSLLA